MGIRQTMNDRPAVAGAVAVVVMLFAAVLIVRNGCDGSKSGPAEPPKQFFTTDDGKTWFAADGTRIPPFDLDGKPAYRARVYRCANGKTFVSYLERYAEPDRKRLQESVDAQKAKGTLVPTEDAFLNVLEVKRPGEKEWVRFSKLAADKFQAIQRPVCPEGGGPLEAVLPK